MRTMGIRWRLIPVFILGAGLLPLHAQNGMPLAGEALEKLTNGQNLANITLQGNVTYSAGSDQDSGTFTLQATGPDASAVVLNLSQGRLQWLHGRNNLIRQAYFVKSDGKSLNHTAQSAWTDAAWFYPGVGLLSELSGHDAARDGQLIALDLGQVSQAGQSVIHLELHQQLNPGQATKAAIILAAKRTREDLYLDPATLLPEFLDYRAPSPQGQPVRIEVRYGNYQLQHGLEIPFHIQRWINGGLVMDMQVTQAQWNTGISSDSFLAGMAN
jgi:hypothetical protein